MLLLAAAGTGRAFRCQRNALLIGGSCCPRQVYMSRSSLMGLAKFSLWFIPDRRESFLELFAEGSVNLVGGVGRLDCRNRSSD